MNKIIQRITRQLGIPNIVNDLAQKLSPTDLQSLLLAVYHKRIEKLQPGDVIKKYADNRFVQPCRLAAQRLTAFDLQAFDILPGDFTVMELSPVAPLGSCSVIAPVDQNNIVSTIRNTEVCADNTNMMALETVHRRRAEPRITVKLCSSQRVLRAQKFDKPAAFPHFRVLSLVTAGSDNGNFSFEISNICEHLQYYLNVINQAKESGYNLAQITLHLSAFDEQLHDDVEQKIKQPLSEQNNDVSFVMDQERTEARGYYQSIAFRIYIKDLKGEQFLILDGGLTDWTQQLLGNKKERLLISGFGSERFIFCFA